MRDSSQFDPLFEAAGVQYGVDPNLLRAVGFQESGMNAGTRDSYQGAQGLMQMLPGTAASMGASDPRDPAQAIPAAARYLREGFDKTGSAAGAVMYYHGGPDQRQWGPKTHAYVQSVGARYSTMSNSKPAEQAPSFVDDLYKTYSGSAATSPAPAATASGAPSDMDALYQTYSTPAAPAAPPAPAPAVATNGPSDVPPQAPRVVVDAAGNQTPAKPLTNADMAEIRANPQPVPVARIDSPQAAVQALGELGRYAGGQVAAALPAIPEQFVAGRDLAASGIHDIQQGHSLPSFPSSDPRTWQAGGIAKTAAGGMGAGFSWLTGPVNKLVQEPITELSGNPVAGEVAGAAVNALGGNIAGKFMFHGAPADPETIRLAGVASREGIPIRAGQISTSPLVNKLDQAAGWMPGSGRVAEDAAQQSAFTKAVSRTFGESTDQITRTTIGRAQARIGNDLNEIEARTPIKFDNDVMNQLGQVESDAARAFTPEGSQYKQIKNQIDQIVNVAAQHNGTVPGDVWAKFSHYKSPLSRLADSQDSDVAGLAGEIKSAMQDAVQRNAAPGDAQAYTAARFQYKNLKTVEPLVTKGTPGEISPLGLNQRVNAKFGTTNAGPLGDLADAAQRFLRPPRDSGTPLGNLAINALTYPGTVIGGAISGAGYLGGLSPEVLAAGGASALTGMGVSRLASAVLNNPLYRNALLRGASGPGPVNKLIYSALPNAPTQPAKLER